jgi:chromosomal replication initiator protein
LSVDIQPPNLEIRIAILLEKAEQNGIRLDYNIIEFIAKHIKKNVRDLEGAIIRILAKSSLMNKEIDFQLVKEVIRERIGSSFSPELSIEDVVKKVSEISNVSEIEIVGKSRKMEVAEARQVSMYLCRKIIGTSLNNIGVFFGGRDHSTVIHAVKNWENLPLLDLLPPPHWFLISIKKKCDSSPLLQTRVWKAKTVS